MLKVATITRDSPIGTDARRRKNPTRNSRGSTNGGIRAQSTQTPSTYSHATRPRSTEKAIGTNSYRRSHIPDEY